MRRFLHIGVLLSLNNKSEENKINSILRDEYDELMHISVIFGCCRCSRDGTICLRWDKASMTVER